MMTRSGPYRIASALVGIVMMGSAFPSRGLAEKPFPGDGAFRAMNYASAVRSYDSVAAAQPRSAEPLWRLARVEVCIGDTVPRPDQQAHYRMAADFARKCIALDPTSAEGHSWLAAALGNVAMDEGSKGKVRLCDTIKGELDRAIQLDSTDDLAYSILGSFYRALGKVNWIERTLAKLLYGSLPAGGFPEAEAALEKAISLSPTIMRHHFELGLLYKDWGRPRRARAEFQLALSCPIQVASDRRRVLQARRLLER